MDVDSEGANKEYGGCESYVNTWQLVVGDSSRMFGGVRKKDEQISDFIWRRFCIFWIY